MEGEEGRIEGKKRKEKKLKIMEEEGIEKIILDGEKKQKEIMEKIVR